LFNTNPPRQFKLDSAAIRFAREEKAMKKDIENSSYTRLLLIGQPSDEHPNVGRSVISKEQF